MVDLDEVGWVDLLNEPSTVAYHYPFQEINGDLVATGSCDNPLPSGHDDPNTCTTNIGFGLDANDDFTNADKIVFNSNALLGDYTIKYELVDTSNNNVLGTYNININLLPEVTITPAPTATKILDQNGGTEVTEFLPALTSNLVRSIDAYYGIRATSLVDFPNVHWRISVAREDGAPLTDTSILTLTEKGWFDAYGNAVEDSNYISSLDDGKIVLAGNSGWGTEVGDFTNVDLIHFNGNAPLGVYLVTRELIDETTNNVISNAYTQTINLNQVQIDIENPNSIDPSFVPQIGADLLRTTDAYIGRESTYLGPAFGESIGGQDTLKWKVTITGSSSLTNEMIDLDEVGWIDLLNEPSITAYHYPFTEQVDGSLVAIGSCDDPLPSGHENSCTTNIGFGLDENDIFSNADKINFNTNTPVGQYTIKYELVNTVGDVIISESFEQIVNVLNNLPVLDPIGDQEIDELQPLTFLATATDIENSLLTFSLNGEPEGVIIDPITGEFSWTPTEAQGPGDYTFEVQVADADGGTDSEEITVTVNSVNDAPTITLTLPNGGEFWNAIKEITWDATDVDGDLLTITIQKSNDNGALWVDVALNELNDGSYDWNTSTTADGLYLIRVIAFDGQLTSQDDSNTPFTVDNTNPSIITYTIDNLIFSPNSDGIKDSVSIDLEFSEMVSASLKIKDSNGNVIRNLYSSPAVINPQPKLWDGKDNSDNLVSDGVYTVEVIITDKAGNSITDSSKTILLDTTNPEINYVLLTPEKLASNNNINIVAKVTESNIDSVTAQVLDDNENPVDGLDNLGLSLEDDLWKLTQNISDLALGEYTLRIIATDLAGNSETDDEQFEVVTEDNSAEGSHVEDDVTTTDNNVVIDASPTPDTNVNIEINTTLDIVGATLTVTEYNTALNTTTVGIPALNKYIQIEASPDLSAVIDTVLIKVSYTDAEINTMGLDESTLRLYFYNETTTLWEPFNPPNGGVNTVDNYVYAITDHFSTWGVFGNSVSAAGGGGGGAGGAGGGGAVFTPTPVTTILTEQPFAYPDCKTNADCNTGETCQYVVGEYYQQCVATAAPTPTAEVPTAGEAVPTGAATAPITGAAITNVFKTTTGKGILVALVIIIVGLGAWYYIFKRK